jgi:hypothetical protein
MAGMGRAIGFGAVTGLLFTSIVLGAALVYSFWIAPEGGDSWDAAYFFTHGAFFVLFAVGFAPGFAWKRWKKSLGKPA